MFDNLTSREREVLALMVKGMGNIACQQLGYTFCASNDRAILGSYRLLSVASISSTNVVQLCWSGP